MHKFFYPETLAIYGLSAKAGNTPRIIAENCLRWGFRGPIFGVNPAGEETKVGSIKMVRRAVDLPLVPDLAALLIPAKYVPEAIDDCGRAGIRRLAIQAGGFNESSVEGAQLAARLTAAAKKYDIRFVGPNGLTLANTANGLCLPFVPSCPVRRGGFSLITQSGGLGLFLWNLLESEQVGLAKFVSIGNKLDLDETDFLRYLGTDPETRVIGLYLESITCGRRLIDLAEATGKPVIVYKANTTTAGSKAAMSHTSAISSNNAISDCAFERAGIIRIDHFHDFITTAKAFDLPPMRGKRIMAMSPAGGLAVAMADLCEQHGFEFADPGDQFYSDITATANAGIIRLSNPLDMGDLYQIDQYPAIFSHALASDQVDGAVYVSQWPRMPEGGDDVFTSMFNTDIFPETSRVIRSADKPLAVALYGDGPSLLGIKQQLSIPIFNGPEEAIVALRRQALFHAHKAAGPFTADDAKGCRYDQARSWLQKRSGVIGEEALELLAACAIPLPLAGLARTAEEAGQIADTLGYPVVLKVVSADAVHKTEAGGVITGVLSRLEAVRGFDRIVENLRQWSSTARMDGVRVVAMAPDGEDMFIGGIQDPSFGPVVLFGRGGVFIEVFNDVERVLCPSARTEIKKKICRLKSSALLAGVRGRKAIDLDTFVDSILNISHLLAHFPQIAELDINPVRLLADGQVWALDARMLIQPPAAAADRGSQLSST